MTRLETSAARIADVLSPDSLCRDGGPSGPVKPGADGRTVDGVDAIEGSGIGGPCDQIGVGASGADQQAIADG